MADRKFGVEVALPVVHYLAQRITFADSGVTFSLGYLPEGAIIVEAGVVVTTAFNSNTSDTLNLGNAGDADEYLSGVDLQTAGRYFDATELDASPLLQASTEQEIKAVFTADGTGGDAATEGECFVYVMFLPRYVDRA